MCMDNAVVLMTFVWLACPGRQMLTEGNGEVWKALPSSKMALVTSPS